MQCNNHCFAVLWLSSEVLISRIEPCQTAIAKGQFKKRWDVVSSSSSHIRHLLEVGIPLLFRFTKTGILLCRNFQMNVRIFKGNLTFQNQLPYSWSYIRRTLRCPACVVVSTYGTKNDSTIHNCLSDILIINDYS